MVPAIYSIPWYTEARYNGFSLYYRSLIGIIRDIHILINVCTVIYKVVSTVLCIPKLVNTIFSQHLVSKHVC